MRRILVTVTDGALATAAGIHLLWQSLIRHRREIKDEWEPVVLYPSWAWPPTDPCAALLLDHRIVAIDQKRHADPYAAKMVLRSLVSTLPDATEILYLDYDHLCLSPFDPPTPPESLLHVGSRVGPLELYEARTERCRELWRLLDGKQLNTSLIHGRCPALREATLSWETTYEEIAGLVHVRGHEEAAFFASAARAGVEVRPVATRTQAEWSEPDPAAPLFHFGGDSPRSLALKRALPQLAQKWAVPRECAELLAQDDTGRRLLRELSGGPWLP